MSERPVVQDLKSVSTLARFSASAAERPVALVKEPGQGPDQHSGAMRERKIAVYDARPIADTIDLEREGFALLCRQTAVTDFYDDEQIRQVYYPETEGLIKDVTGAAEVIVFDHTIRVEDEKKRALHKVRAPVSGMHNDFTEASAPERVRDLLPAEKAAARLKGRFASINVWRPIRSPVQSKPLAICEYGSIGENDLVASERHYPDGRIGGIYYLVHNPGQRWYYFPEMTDSEVILLKCYDSLKDGTARWTAHGSFDDPSSPADAEARESIEMRTLLFFD